MIFFYLVIDENVYHIELDKKMLMKDAVKLILNESYEYVYLSLHRHIEKLDKSFEEAKIFNGEYLHIIK